MRKLISIEQATPVSKQLNHACSDCPMRRDALNGWLGGYTVDQYRMIAHSDATVDCHAHTGTRCAGMAIYRTNVCKWQKPEHKLPADRETIFASPTEFMEHHNAKPGTIIGKEQGKENGTDNHT